MSQFPSHIPPLRIYPNITVPAASEEQQQQIPLPPILSKDDINVIFSLLGYNEEDNLFIDSEAMGLLLELGKNFVQEILDIYTHKKRQLNSLDIKRAAIIKFGHLDFFSDYRSENGTVLMNRTKELIEIEDKVRENDKKFKSKE